jgi:hypothetical protein
MKRYTPHFEHVEGMGILSLKAREVPGKLWSAILTAHTDLVGAQLVDGTSFKDDREGARAHAAVIVGSDIPSVAIDKYQHPNKYRGTGGTHKDQFYRDPRMTVVLDPRNDNALVAAVGIVRNTSPSVLPGTIGKQVEQRAKMYARPEIPIVGGHRYEKVTGVVFVDEPAAALVGLHHAVQDRHPQDHVSAYHIPRASADAEMGFIVNAAGLGYKGTEQTTGIPGYIDDTSLNWYVASNAVVLANIEGYRGAREAIGSMHELTSVPPQWQGE